jgi:DNA mismatch endonuclease (patch repair protein)
VDNLNEQRRSENMRRIKSKNTKPELLLRSLLHRQGYRFRVHLKDLPGRPDIVFPGRRKLIFVHGCFWHQHGSCREGRLPGTRREYWLPKLTRNQERDAKAIQQLREQGWETKIVWECEIERSLDETLDSIQQFLAGQPERQSEV